MDDEHIGMLSNYKMHGWSSMKVEMSKEVQLHCSFGDEITVTCTIASTGRIIIATLLQMKVPDQLHINHMGIENIKLLTH